MAKINVKVPNIPSVDTPIAQMIPGIKC